MTPQDALDKLYAQIETVQDETDTGDREIARAVENVLRRQDVVEPYREEPEHRDALLRLAWWMFVRAPGLDLRHFVYSSMALDVIQSDTRDLASSFEDLKNLEDAFSLDDPAPSPIEETDEVLEIREAFKEGADHVEEVFEHDGDAIQELITNVVAKLLQSQDLFQKLSRNIAEDLMEQFSDLAESDAFDDAMHTPLGEGTHDHAEDYEELDAPDAYVERGDKRYEQGDLDGAIADYTEALEIGDEETDIYRKRGVSRAAMNDVDGAIEDWSRALELDPENVEARVDRALVFYENDQPERALEDYDKAAEQEERPEVFANRGVARFQTGDVQGAREDLDRALELDEESVPAYLNRALVRQATGDLSGAFEDYDHVLEIGPENADAYASRGYLRLEKGELEGAVSDFQEATEIRPYDATTYYNLGNAYAEQAEWEEAIEQYDQAIDLDPEDPQAYSNRGSAKIQLKDFHGALDDWNEATDLDPYNPVPYVKRAGVWQMLDEEDEAMDDLRKALEVAPEDWQLRPRVEHMVEEITGRS
ncbi:MAG: tetratricopeptide repeat protein [Bradymonadaceae bacterium]